jgi:sRNA-binding carbon storage regulator CsrA
MRDGKLLAEICLLSIRTSSRAKLGFEAPQDVVIVRKELLPIDDQTNEEAGMLGVDGLGP